MVIHDIFERVYKFILKMAIGMRHTGHNPFHEMMLMNIVCLNLREYEKLNSVIVWYICYTGGRLNKKDGLTRYGDSHVKDKTS